MDGPGIGHIAMEHSPLAHGCKMHRSCPSCSSTHHRRKAQLWYVHMILPFELFHTPAAGLFERGLYLLSPRDRAIAKH